MHSHLLIPIADESSIGQTRRAAASVTQNAGLNPTDAGRVAIIATELATNLLKHATPATGRMLLLANGAPTSPAIEVMALDSGPGIANVSRCFEDGYSTAGTPGNGLGAVKRLSDELDVFSTATGTVVWSRVAAAAQNPKPSSPAIRIAGISIPLAGETHCGDAWHFARRDDGAISIVLADGLGHGPLAFDASTAAIKTFDANPFNPPESLLQDMHHALSATRGAAVTIAQISLDNQMLRYGGVGNISGSCIAPGAVTSRGLVSHNGAVGHQMRKTQAFELPCPPGSTLILHSDGLQTRWHLEQYPGLISRHPAVIAGVLYRDFCRGRDDATVIVLSVRAS